MKAFYCILLMSSMLLLSCSSNSIDDLEPIGNEELPDLVTYQEVRSTFDNICSACHANPPQNGAPMPLINYQNVKEAMQNRGLLDRISRNEGASGLMPLGGPRLPQAVIDLIFQWNEDGLLEN